VSHEPQLEAREVRSRAARGVLSVGARNVLVRALGFVGTVVLARLLTPHQFGLLAFGFAVKSISDVMASGGLAAGLIRRSEPPTPDDMRSAQGVQLATTSALTLIVVALGVVLGGAAAIAAVMALSLPIFALRVPTMVVLERNLDWSLAARTEVTEALAYNATAIALVVAGAGPLGAAIAVPVQAATGTALLLWRGPIGIVRPRFSLATGLPLLRFGVQFQSVMIVTAIREQGLNLLVGATAGIATLGVWSVAYRVLQPIGLVLQSLWRVSYPASARILEAGEDPRRLTERALRLSAVVIGVPAVLVAGTAPDLVPAVFGERWSDAAAALPWGAAALMIIGPVSTFPIGFLQARGDVGRVVLIVGAQTVTWLAAAAVLSGPLGVEGIAIAMLAGAAALAVAVVLVMRRHVEVRAVSPIWPAATAATVAAALAWATADVLDPSLLGLIASACVALVAYVGGLLALARADLLGVLRMTGVTLPSRGRRYARARAARQGS
jgi:O-antigen/teichoic acid export membrane protein